VRGIRIAVLFVILTAAPQAPALDFSLKETKHFAIRVGEKTSAVRIRDASAVFEAAYETMEQALGTIDAQPIDVVIFAETGDFTAETGLAVWSAAATVDGAIYMQPASVLAARGVLDTTIRHEVCLVFLVRRYGADMPAWLAEGLAVYHAGEIEALRRGLSGARPPISAPGDIETLLFDRIDRQRNRWGYVLAYEAVRPMIEAEAAAHARRGGTQ
jgi:hypothetical protein